MADVAVLSLHTSPLTQPGSGDAGGMNVYVRELAASLAQAGVDVRVFVRRYADDLPERVQVEPGLEVIHVAAGPVDLPKEDLPSIVDEFADGVAAHLAERPADVLHANYWLSAVAAHRLKHQLDLPLVATFHTLARVKAEAGDAEPLARAVAEADVIGCCDAICASNPVEAEQLVAHYAAPPERIELVPPGVDHAFFSPGPQHGARAALGLDDGVPARVWNDRAALEVPVRVSERVRPGVVAIPWGWWSTHHGDGPVANSLTNTTLTDWGGGVAYSDTRVSLARA